MELKTLNREQLVEAVASLTEDQKDEIRAVATHLEIGFSGNSGFNTIKEKVVAHLADPLSDVPEPEPEETSDEHNLSAMGLTLDTTSQPQAPTEVVKKKEEWTDAKLMKVKYPATLPTETLIRRAMRLQFMRLVRVRITNLDPADNELQGDIFTVNSKYLGKVSKYIPYDDTSENGYHIPYVLLEELKGRKFPMRKEQKRNKFGVKTYKTIMAPKFAIEELEPLTREELEELAKRQAASHAIDN